MHMVNRGEVSVYLCFQAISIGETDRTKFVDILHDSVELADNTCITEIAVIYSVATRKGYHSVEALI